jgi:hypothetical protein
MGAFDADRDARLQDILSVPSAYVGDGLVSMHNHEFMADPAFAAAYARGVKAAGRDYGWPWRVHIGLWAAAVASRLPGDFVECGVNAGFMASAIMQRLDWNRLGKTFWLLDTFKGLDETQVSDAERAGGILEKNAKLIESGFYVTDPAAVRANFAEWTRVEVVEGSIPQTLARVRADEIAFLHVDLNCAPPEVAAVERLWPRLVPGAMVLLDDYAYWGYREQKVAMDALAARLGMAIASLPTGQGLAVKS